LYINYFYVIQLKQEAQKNINYYINHDDATQQLVMDNMTLDVPDVVSYITTWEKKIGDMVFLVEIPTKANAKTVWRNNIWKYQPGSTAIMCRIIYRYIKFILIATGKFRGRPSWWSFWMLAEGMLWKVEQRKWPFAHREGGAGIWTFPMVLYQKKKNNYFNIAMQELRNREVLVLMWVKCQYLNSNNHRNPPIHVFN
jgi:hypothetical protein